MAPHGRQLVEWEIVDIVEQSRDARVLIISAPTGTRPAGRLDYPPRQYLTLRVPGDRTGWVVGCRWLDDSARTDDLLAVTIKRTSGGDASDWLCDHARPGMCVHAVAPSEALVPGTLHADFLFMAADAGIAAVMALLRSALAAGDGRVALVYANRDERSVMFADALRELADHHADRLSVTYWLESMQGLPGVAELTEVVRPFADRSAFVCGPSPFTATAHAALIHGGVDPERIHVEIVSSVGSGPFRATRIGSAAGDRRSGQMPAKAVVTLDGATR